MQDLKNTSPRVTCRNAVPQNRAEAQRTRAVVKNLKNNNNNQSQSQEFQIPPLSRKIANQIGLLKDK